VSNIWTSASISHFPGLKNNHIHISHSAWAVLSPARHVSFGCFRLCRRVFSSSSS
jgi:hypothetical protein